MLQYGCGCVPQPNCSHLDEEVVIAPTLGEVGVTQPLGSSPQLGNLRLARASDCCSSYDSTDALLLLSIDDVVHVSDASPLYIFTSQYTYSTPLTILPSESCSLSALGTSST